jgi:hypothetical protein
MKRLYLLVLAALSAIVIAVLAGATPASAHDADAKCEASGLAHFTASKYQTAKYAVDGGSKVGFAGGFDFTLPGTAPHNVVISDSSDGVGNRTLTSPVCTQPTTTTVKATTTTVQATTTTAPATTTTAPATTTTAPATTTTQATTTTAAPPQPFPGVAPICGGIQAEGYNYPEGSWYSYVINGVDSGKIFFSPDFTTTIPVDPTISYTYKVTIQPAGGPVFISQGSRGPCQTPTTTVAPTTTAPEEIPNCIDGKKNPALPADVIVICGPADPTSTTAPLPDDCLGGTTRWTLQPCGEESTTTTVVATSVVESPTPPTAPPGGLPVTGSGDGPMAAIAAGLVAIGAVMAVVAARRRQAA